MPMVGGRSAVKQADEAIKEVISAVLEELKSKIVEKFNSASAPRSLEPIAYQTQVVAGTNFFVKIKLDEGDYVHARIFRNLEGVATVHSVTEKKAETDEIEYF